MKAFATIVALVVLVAVAGPAAARGSVPTWTCLDRPGLGALASDSGACGRANPYESAASATERTNAALLRRYPDEATFEARRKEVLERMRAQTPADEQDAAAARVDRAFDAQLKRMRPLWRPAENP